MDALELIKRETRRRRSGNRDTSQTPSGKASVEVSATPTAIPLTPFISGTFAAGPVLDHNHHRVGSHLVSQARYGSVQASEATT